LKYLILDRSVIELKMRKTFVSKSKTNQQKDSLNINNEMEIRFCQSLWMIVSYNDMELMIMGFIQIKKCVVFVLF
jgi:hypothetical protein